MSAIAVILGGITGTLIGWTFAVPIISAILRWIT